MSIRRSHPGSKALHSLTKKRYLDAYCIKPKAWSNQRLSKGMGKKVHVRSGIFQLLQSLTVFWEHCSFTLSVQCLHQVNNSSCFSSSYTSTSKECVIFAPSVIEGHTTVMGCFVFGMFYSLMKTPDLTANTVVKGSFSLLCSDC